jgi:replicative DNA helicase
LNTMETALYKISDSNLKTDFVDVADGLVELINRVDFLKSQNTSVTGVSTGYPVLNGITHGWQPTDLIILAARPSIGKTAFALNLARNATIDRINPVSVGFFSLEMSTQQLLQRLVAMDSGVHMSALASGSVDNPLTAFVSGRLFGEGEDVGKIYACDQAGLGLFELKSKARRMVGKFGVKLIIIDYLQLMSGDRGYGGNREQEISSISRGLKGMAKELKVPVIALSQLNRSVEARGAKTPRLSDLRESGAIEQDADMVAFLYRPDEEATKQDAGLQNTGLLTIAKHRNGSLGEVVFRVNNGLQQWREVTESVF